MLITDKQDIWFKRYIIRLYLYFYIYKIIYFFIYKNMYVFVSRET